MTTMIETTPVLLPLTSTITLAQGGGKGANLARMVRSGLPVPSGFVVTTDAYNEFVATNELDLQIATTINNLNVNALDALEAASSSIRAHFEAATIPDTISAPILAAYHALGSPAVAVRSSATAEDLPDMSFAGQQDTLLNIHGDEALLAAIRTCWGSLWTARAIGYRARNKIEHHDLALAVVVQTMVQSEASGVLFTVNPLTGKRSEIVIDATLGLGEALVSGQVEPDHYIVAGAQITHKQLGAKAVTIVSRAGGGTDTLQGSAANQQALPDVTILDLAKLGRGIAGLFGTPQDIEWAWADGKLWIVQSRPITSLFPLPINLPAEPLRVLFSFGAVQGVLDPITPLGRDLFRHIAMTGSNFFGKHATPDSQMIVFEAGERLFINVTGLVKHKQLRHGYRAVLPAVEPASGEVLETIWNEPALQPQASNIQLKQYLRAANAMRVVLANIARNLRHPAQRRVQLQHHIEQTLTRHAQQCHQATSLSQRLDLFEQMPLVLGQQLLPFLVSMIASSMTALRLLNRLTQQLPHGSQLTLQVTRGLPYNVTTEMDLALWDTARTIQRDASAATHLMTTPAPTLAAELLANRLPPTAQTAISTFMQRYGMRGIAEIDLGHPRWRDQPEQILQMLNSYLQISDPDRAPDAVFARGVLEADNAIEQLSAELRRTRFGWLKARLARWLASRVRQLAGLRETPKFTIIRMFDQVHQGLLASGRELVHAGVLDRADDVFMLNLAELRQLAHEQHRDWKALIMQRRASYEREMRRRQVPRLLLTDGRAFYNGVASMNENDSTKIVGSPVSPGSVEGIVHVVFEPHGTQLAPGEILVCHGTDPAWTPLFLAAGGLVMEVGGLMTHGSVVAREYGIPAVVGVHHATSRLQTGQKIRVDGTTGQITVLDA